MSQRCTINYISLNFLLNFTDYVLGCPLHINTDSTMHILLLTLKSRRLKMETVCFSETLVSKLPTSPHGVTTQKNNIHRCEELKSHKTFYPSSEVNDSKILSIGDTPQFDLFPGDNTPP
jgi:hypothetical protein